MKLKITEHKAFIIAMEEKGKDSSHFTFSKRRGLVHIQDKNREKPFTFYRKKTTLLDDTKKWLSKEAYYLNLPSRGAEELSWEELLREFGNWLEGEP